MINAVIPITITEVNWQSYIEACLANNSEPPTKRLDDANFTQRDLAAYLASIATNDLRNALRNTSYILRHASAGFLIHATKEINVIQNQSKLNIVAIGEDLYLATGTIEDWKYAIVELSIKQIPTKIRYIMNCCLLFLERGGLMEVFGNYRKETQPDSTFILTRKD